MVCPTPDLTEEIPVECQPETTTVSQQMGQTTTLNPAHLSTQAPISVDYEQLDLYIGFIMDNFQRYRDLNVSLPEYAKIALSENPSITHNPQPVGFRPFWPYRDNSIHIKVS